jgi:hypothetical protein
MSSFTTALTPTAKESPPQDRQKLRERLKELFDQPDLLPDKLLGFLVDYMSVQPASTPATSIFGLRTFLGIFAGSGSPQGVVAAPVGSLYTRTDGGASTTLYVKESGGSSDTGWVAK